jgi:hypothetical protein
MRKGRLFLVVLLTTGGLLGLAFDLYVGYYDSAIDHDEHRIYFLKSAPTFRREFVNPFANEGDAPTVDNLPSSTRRELIDYCKNAYGLIQADRKSLEACRLQVLKDVQ